MAFWILHLEERIKGLIAYVEYLHKEDIEKTRKVKEVQKLRSDLGIEEEALAGQGMLHSTDEEIGKVM